MSHAATPHFDTHATRTSTTAFDKFIIIPLLACAFIEIILPILTRIDTGPLVGGAWTPFQEEIMKAPRLEHRIFWPAMALISVFWAIRYCNRLYFSPHIIWLYLYLAFAGLSIIWSIKPDVSTIRFTQQAMIITSIVIPTLLANRHADLIRGLFIVFAITLFIALLYVLNQEPLILEGNRICYYGQFTFKGELGETAAFAFVLSAYEILHKGWRRIFGIAVAALAIYLLILSDSKGSLGAALIALVLAAATIYLAKKLNLSVLTVLLPIPIAYIILSYGLGNLLNRISWHVYGNYTLSGRQSIWDFANMEIAKSPIIGWGYQVFWLSGPDAPSIREAPGWIKYMPNAHNGYLDTQIDMGYIGLILLIIFLFTSLHAVGRVLNSDKIRAWNILALMLFIILTNFLETGWLHAFERLWLMFLFAVAEVARYWKPLPSNAPALEKELGMAPIVS